MRSRLPNCTECWGCTTQLRSLEKTQLANTQHSFQPEAGRSLQWLFLAGKRDGGKIVGQRTCIV
jgi:hypothetical protein